MKKNLLSIAVCLSATLLWSCSDNNSSSSGSTADSSNSSAMNNNDTMNGLQRDTGSTTGASAANNINTTPLSKADSSFVMEAAMGGMMEVQAGNLAQQKGASDRVKAFGAMMVADHSKANDELKGLASSRGLSIPSTLPANMQKHLDDMSKLSGKAFDQHYIGMMVDDHKKDVDKFKKQANSGADAQLKTWAGNTLPTLQKHLDSVQAIHKGM